MAEKTAEPTRIKAVGQCGPCADVGRSSSQKEALAGAAKARDVMKVHRVLADPSGEITQKTVQAIGIATTGQSGPREARLQKVKRRQCIDGPSKTSSDGVGDEDRGVKPGKAEPVGRTGALQLEEQELELEQQRASQERKKEIQ